MLLPYRILERKRAGMRLDAEEIRSVAQGATDGSWSEGQLAAFLMAAAIRGLDGEETRALTLAMRDSGELWELGAEVPRLCDKHSTGGVGDKVSLVIAPLLASCGLPVFMLAGRGLGHTGGTIDKLESIPGMDLRLDRGRCLDLLARCGMAIGAATAGLAPADRRLYALRDVTATVDSIPLITASILSKKLATAAAAVVFDVKTGNGAFLPELDRSLELARGLVETSRGLGTPAACLVTDMSQPLGRWAGHAAEVRESLDALAGEGPEDLMEVTFALAEEVARLAGQPVERREMAAAIASGRAREAFERWAALQSSGRSSPGAPAASPPWTCASSGSSWSRPAAAGLTPATPSTSGSHSTPGSASAPRWRRGRSWPGSICGRRMSAWRRRSRPASRWGMKARRRL
jgi:pyrimidine-nucleoside phosphorylase